MRSSSKEVLLNATRPTQRHALRAASAAALRLGRPFGLAAVLGLGLLTVMCGRNDRAKVKIHPPGKSEAGQAGDMTGVITVAGRGMTGVNSGGAGGTSNGNVNGASGEPGQGEGGAGLGTGNDATGGNLGNGASNGSGGTGGSDGSGGSTSGGTDSDGGTNSVGGSSGNGGTSSAGSSTGGGATGGTASGGRATGGTAGVIIAVGGVAGIGGASAGTGGSSAGTGGSGGAADCSDKTNCCAADDPVCDVEGCPPSGEDFCCVASAGIRVTCDPVTEVPQLVCINPCTARSYGTGSCTGCVQAGDPLCTDPTWVDPCLVGDFAYCSDPVSGYRLSCSGISGGEFYVDVACTCSAGPVCEPTPCCLPGGVSCTTDGCDPLGDGYCCNDASYEEYCQDFSGSTWTQQFACINDCTDQSYGTGSCVDCVVGSDPLCDYGLSWTNACNQFEPTYCSDPVTGLRMQCIETIASDGTHLPNTTIACTCNPG